MQAVCPEWETLEELRVDLAYTGLVPDHESPQSGVKSTMLAWEELL